MVFHQPRKLAPQGIGGSTPSLCVAACAQLQHGPPSVGHHYVAVSSGFTADRFQRACLQTRLHSRPCAAPQGPASRGRHCIAVCVRLH